jgi:exonuclease SbcC
VINRGKLIATLRSHYPALEQVSDVLLRAVDLYEGRPYAIRYFDLKDDILSVVSDFGEYQERILGDSYYNVSSRSDLRWNHYLYLLTSQDVETDPEQAKAKALIETDREYARKLVLTEAELENVLDWRITEKNLPSLPPDPISEWAKALEQHDLGFVVDEALQVPAVVRLIEKGDRPGLKRPPSAPNLNEAEQHVAKDFLKTLVIHHFRRYPVRKEFEFGTVNLITGVNGVGKTSLLEAIEYLYCGRVRRSDGASQKASVMGELQNSGLYIETKSGTQAAKLRARHLGWYGKADLQKVTIADSFGKFNFLDTDAAVRLTVEQSRDRINADLAQLLLGAEAAKTLDRFERLAKNLNDTRRDIERDIDVRDQRRLDASARLERLRSVPQESDQLFSELNEMLAQVGWTNPPSSKDDTESLTGALSNALISIGVVKSAGSTAPRDINQLKILREQLLVSQGILKEVLDTRRRLSETETDLTQKLRELDTQADALLQLMPMLDAGLDDLARDVNSRSQRVTELTAALAEGEAAVRTIQGETTLPGKSLRQAIDHQTKELEKRAAALKQAQRSLTTLEQTQATVTSLAQQLRVVARRLIEQTRDHTHCPLCGTEFELSRLETHIQETAQSQADLELQQLRSRIQEYKLANQKDTAVLQALEALNQYQSSRNRTTIRAVINQIETDRSELNRLQAELDALRQTVQKHEKKGWTFDRLREIAHSGGLGPSEINRQTVEAASASLTRHRNQYIDTLAKIGQDRQRLEDRVGEIAKQYNLPLLDVGEVLAGVSNRAKMLEDVSRALEALRHLLTLGAQSSELQLEARLREAQDAVVRLRAASAREKERDDTIKVDSKIVADATAEIAALRVQVTRIDSAHSVIAELVQKQSEQALTNQVLRENGVEIAATFRKIHAPSEFDVEVVDDGLKIVRRSTKLNVELDEMSSGQRIAFTLSLFLAMNGRLLTGPRVIIFDDPVAHVDDINTLSFLDHLRDIALAGGRQLFFATADSRLAALTARKFRFMGEEFKEIALNRD